MFTRRAVKKAVTLWTVSPIYADLAKARLTASARRLLGRPGGKAIACAAGVGAAIAAAATGRRIAAAALAGLTIPLAVGRVAERMRRSRQLRELSLKSWPQAAEGM